MNLRFRRIEDRNEWKTEDGCWLLEKTWESGPRGGSHVVWNLYTLNSGRFSRVASERRLRDIWSALAPGLSASGETATEEDKLSEETVETTAATQSSVEGWYGPPNSRRWHYFTDADGRSLCGKWLVMAPLADVIGRAFGPADGDCATCKRKLEAGGSGE